MTTTFVLCIPCKRFKPIDQQLLIGQIHMFKLRPTEPRPFLTTIESCRNKIKLMKLGYGIWCFLGYGWGSIRTFKSWIKV